jgi:superfamily II RNA helicase
LPNTWRTLYLRPQQQAITELTTELTKLDIQLAPVDVKQLSSYEKLSERLKEERRLLKTLQTQAEETRAGEIAQVIQYVTSWNHPLSEGEVCAGVLSSPFSVGYEGKGSRSIALSALLKRR